MSIRKRKRRLMRTVAPASPMQMALSRANQAGGPITFPPPTSDLGTVTHAIGPLVPLPARRDIRFARRLARMRERVRAALHVTEE